MIFSVEVDNGDGRWTEIGRARSQDKAVKMAQAWCRDWPDEVRVRSGDDIMWMSTWPATV